MARFTLELGGESPLIVLDDADPRPRRQRHRDQRHLLLTRAGVHRPVRASMCSAASSARWCSNWRGVRRACTSARASRPTGAVRPLSPGATWTRDGGHIDNGAVSSATLVTGGSPRLRRRLLRAADRVTSMPALTCASCGRSVRPGRHGGAHSTMSRTPSAGQRQRLRPGRERGRTTSRWCTASCRACRRAWCGSARTTCSIATRCRWRHQDSRATGATWGARRSELHRRLKSVCMAVIAASPVRERNRTRQETFITEKKQIALSAVVSAMAPLPASAGPGRSRAGLRPQQRQQARDGRADSASAPWPARPDPTISAPRRSGARLRTSSASTPTAASTAGRSTTSIVDDQWNPEIAAQVALKLVKDRKVVALAGSTSFVGVRRQRQDVRRARA